MGKPKGDVDSVVDDLVGGSAPAPATPTAAAVTAAPRKKTPAKKAAAAPAASATAPTKAPKRKAKPQANVAPTKEDLKRYATAGKKAATGPTANKAKVPASNKAPTPANKTVPAKKAVGAGPKRKVGAAKPAATNGGTRSAKGAGKFYFDPAEKDKVMGNLRKLKTPITTADYAAKHSIPTFKVRLAAAALAANKEMKLVKSGAVLTMQPK